MIPFPEMSQIIDEHEATMANFRQMTDDLFSRLQSPLPPSLCNLIAGYVGGDIEATSPTSQAPAKKGGRCIIS